MTPTTRRIGLALAAAGTATGLAVATSPGAHAEPIWKLHHKATVVTHVAKPNKDVTFSGTLDSTVDIGTGKNNLSAALSVGKGTMKVDLPIIPGKLSVPSVATATLQIEPLGPAKGSFDSGKIDATQQFNVRIVKLAPALLGFINLVPNTCMTETPATMKLSGKLSGLFDPATLKGSYTLPKFKGCGLLTPLVSSLTSGGGNSVQVHLTV